MIIDEEVHLKHYGILRRSGRYPWGSGGNSNQSQRNKAFLDYFDEMVGKGLSIAKVCEGVGISTTEYRAARSMAKYQQKQEQIGWAQRLKNKGLSNVAIGERMGVGESQVRNLLAPGAAAKADALLKTAEVLKKHVDEKTYLDVGIGTENYLGVTKDRMNVVEQVLKEQGYKVHTNLRVPTVGTQHKTTYKVMTPPGYTWSDAQKNIANIRQITEFSNDGGHTFGKIHDPLIVDPKRLAVRFKEDGGDQADGVIYVRAGVKDLAMNNKRYGQVRIKVGPDHYLKGMAIVTSDANIFPRGTDLVFNTNKENKTGNKLDALKEISKDPDYPFESVVRQVLADQGTPHERVVSAINIVGTKEESGLEGGWGSWKKNLAAQFLSKQNPSLARAQTDKTYERRKKDLDQIKALTNPAVKRLLLEKFADGADAAAVQLEAAKMSRKQGWHVILPINSLKPNEIYATGFDNGEPVVLIRYPHGGTFEIPELIVNNKNQEAKELLGSARDAVGIHHSVAQQLSGADFDGDTVVVIPNRSRRVKADPALESLMKFNPKDEYPGYPGMKPLGKQEQLEMGNVSNLITDMTIKLAPHNEIARAIRHSMVVIDANNHNLNYRQSAIDHGIAKLKAEYQRESKSGKGASTLISRAGSRLDVPERRARRVSEGGPIDLATGRKMYVPTGRTYVNKKGKVVPRTIKTTKLAEAEDAHELSSGTRIESIYADHANRLKALANDARLTAFNTPSIKRSPSAAKVYASEVQSLASKLAISQENAPLERQAQVIAQTKIKALKAANPNLGEGSTKKMEYQQLEIARARVGANKKDRQVAITQPEWNAIQAGAISNSMLKKILNNTDLELVRKYATPRPERLMTPTNISRAQDLFDRGYTRAEVASRLGVSLTTLDNAMKG